MSIAYTSVQIKGNLLSRRKKRKPDFTIDGWPFQDLEIGSTPTSMAKITDSKNRLIRVVVGCENGDIVVMSWPKGRILARWSSGVDSVTAIHIHEHRDNQMTFSISAFIGTDSGSILSVEGPLLQPNFIRYLGNIEVCCEELLFLDGRLSATSGWRTIRIPLESSEGRRQFQTIFAV